MRFTPAKSRFLRIATRMAVATASMSSALVLSSCAAESGRVPSAPAPIVTGLSETEVVVGQSLKILGTNFPSSDDGWVDVHFAGTFTSEGQATPVDLTIPLNSKDQQTLEWASFGAYRVPFGSGDKVGTFQGYVTGTNRFYDGSSGAQDQSSRVLLSLKVKPSVIVRDFRAVGDGWAADCKEPPAVVFPQLRYRFVAGALGFQPKRFEYILPAGLWIGAEDGQGGEQTTEPTRIEIDSTDAETGLYLRFSPVPEFQMGYRSQITVRVIDQDDQSHDFSYRFAVRRPVETFFLGAMEVAELLQPEPVSGCIPGGGSSIQTSYSETRSETRSRTVQRSLQNGWADTVTSQNQQSYGTSLREGASFGTSNQITVADATNQSVDQSTTSTRADTNSTDWARGFQLSGSESEGTNWKVGAGTTASAEASGKILGVGVSGGLSTTVEGSVGGDRSRTRGYNASADAGGGMSQTESTARARGYQFGLTQTFSEANGFTRNESVDSTSSYTDAVTEGRAIAQNLSESTTDITSVTTTNTTALQVTAWVWAGSYGMWYRQATRLVRRAAIVSYDLCGNGSQVGTADFDDWTWAPDLAVGGSCPPASNLPPAQCIQSPCLNISR